MAEMRKRSIVAPRGGTGGAKPGSGVQRLWGPLKASQFDPCFQQQRRQYPDHLPPSQGPREAFQEPRRGVSVFNGAGKEGGQLRGP